MVSRELGYGFGSKAGSVLRDLPMRAEVNDGGVGDVVWNKLPLLTFGRLLLALLFAVVGGENGGGGEALAAEPFAKKGNAIALMR